MSWTRASISQISLGTIGCEFGPNKRILSDSRSLLSNDSRKGQTYPRKIEREQSNKGVRGTEDGHPDLSRVGGWFVTKQMLAIVSLRTSDARSRVIRNPP